MTIDELIQVAHSDAKAKGWWDEPRNVSEVLMLIVSECGEALEAHRSGRMADLKKFDLTLGWKIRTEEPESFAQSFQHCIKDTFEDELADIVIRIADYIGGGERMFFGTEPSLEAKASGNIGEELLEVVTNVVDGSSAGLTKAVYHVFGIAGAHNIDLWRHIELKLAYNRTRGYKHGRLY